MPCGVSGANKRAAGEKATRQHNNALSFPEQKASARWKRFHALPESSQVWGYVPCFDQIDNRNCP